MLQTLDVAMTHLVVSSWGVVASCNWAQLQSLDMREQQNGLRQAGRAGVC